VNSALYVAIGRRVPRLTTQGDTQATSRPVSANLTSGGQENWHPRPFMTFADIFTRPGPLPDLALDLSVGDHRDGRSAGATAVAPVRSAFRSDSHSPKAIGS